MPQGSAVHSIISIHRRQHHRLNLGTKTLERHHPINHLQWIALRRNRRKPLVRIEKSDLPHRATSANLVVLSQTRTNWLRRLFFEVPYSFDSRSIVGHVSRGRRTPNGWAEIKG